MKEVEFCNETISNDCYHRFCRSIVHHEYGSPEPETNFFKPFGDVVAHFLGAGGGSI